MIGRLITAKGGKMMLVKQTKHIEKSKYGKLMKRIFPIALLVAVAMVMPVMA